MTGQHIRVLATNAKGGELDGAPLARWIAARSKTVPTISAVTEALGPRGNPNKIRKALLDLVPHSEFRTGRDGYARETATLITGNFKLEERHRTVLLCGPGPTGRGGPDQPRYAQVDRLSVKNHNVGFVTVHAPVGTHGDSGAWRKNNQALRWQRGMDKLEKLVTLLRRDGFPPVIAGDFNEFRSSSKQGLAAWANAHHMDAFDTRVMWVLVDRKLHVREHKVIPVPNNISDHPAFLRVDLSI